MTFDGVSGLNENDFTYRNFWTLSLAFYAYVQVLSGVLISGFYQYLYKRIYAGRIFQTTKTPPWIAMWVVPVVYACCLGILPILNATAIFANHSIWLAVGILVGIQVGLFLLGFVFVQYSDRLVLISNCSIGLSLLFLVQLSTMFDYIKNFYFVFLVGLFGGMFLQPLVSGWKIRTVCFLVALGFTFGMAGICVTIYNPNLRGFWLPLKSEMRWSSRFMRSFFSSQQRACMQIPCHVYLTAGSDLSNEVFVNVHMPIGSVSALSIVLMGKTERQTFSAFETVVPLLDAYDQRIVYTAHLTGLSPGEKHIFRILDQDDMYITQGGAEYSFTLPTAAGLRFVVGGDWGSTNDGLDLVKRMAELKPHVIFIGGDVVYDNAFHSCACAWDLFLSSWESRDLIPFSFAAGNHDLGVNDNNAGAYDMQKNLCTVDNVLTSPPLFFSWFPHAHAEICQRSPLKKHSIPDLGTVWMLDSGYITSPAANAVFVTDNMSNATNMAIYHVPLYGSTNEDFAHGDYLRDAWVSPVFDHWAFSACFENHVHAYKQTYPLIQSAPSDGGTVYFGDGKLGVSGRGCPDEAEIISNNSLFAKTGTQIHFFHVQLCPDAQYSVQAISANGEVFDQSSGTCIV